MLDLLKERRKCWYCNITHVLNCGVIVLNEKKSLKDVKRYLKVKGFFNTKLFVLNNYSEMATMYNVQDAAADSEI